MVKKKNIKYIKENIREIIILLLMLFTISYRYCKPFDNTFFIGILGSLVTVYFGLVKHKIENDRMFKELFECFNKRYDRFNDKLISVENKNLESIANKTKYTLDDTEKKMVIDYLNLCAEEYLWYTIKRIDKTVWLAWKEGMLYYFNINPIKETVIKEMLQS